ncbi:sensor histidine kinase [Clostridium estertheticum]|uniref:sensor histidine kinase n=1 Tax=Clostridium estertheticum TaxID=238834 RepID=UPI001CF16025|nr:sensor histidine kinase [Clostridium estertheticum]MCB2308350.1 sensor histidine kinase [Clostridium estertheticum]MCB2346455.1 sensor histidine kinase [Clostridium estertheticum]MCB2349423.1 sensor histidine kinase [Clostridium estertheticum]WAG46401.1 sensor histidine kinase [Clostridium estertheticum]
MKVTDYLKEKKELFILNILFAIFPGMILGLSEDGAFLSTNGLYCIEVMIFISVIYIIVDYLRLNRYCKRLSRLSGNDGLDFIVSLPNPTSYEQKLYTKLIIQLKRNAEKMMEAFEDEKLEDIEFIETWVHEIKTPIAATKLIIENSLDNPTEKVLYIISDEIIKIEDMVQKTICYSQLNDFSRDCQISNVNLQKVVNKCLQNEYSNINNKYLELDIRTLDFEVNSDEKWLYFIIKQILDNAVKYSKEKGIIQIYGINDLHNQKLFIEDSGIGIREEDIRRIFQKGYTGLNGRKKTVSTGVGLYLSYKLARKLGHDIHVSSVLKQGTKVELILQE